MKKSIVRVLALVLMLTLVITSSAAALKLQKNDKSDNVRRLQQALTQLGYYSGGRQLRQRHEGGGDRVPAGEQPDGGRYRRFRDDCSAGKADGH